MPRSTQPANVIQETTDYDQFKFIEGNRELSRGHIERIKSSIEKNGNFLNTSPILVNEKMQIIDGQHRFVAAKELEVPVFYTVGNGMRLNEARAMNILNKNWHPIDYARSYASTGNRAYSTYLKLRMEFDTSHATTLVYINYHEENRLHSKFRNGELLIKNVEKTRAWLSDLNNIVAESVRFKANGAPAKALLRTMQSENYESDRMLRKVKQYPDFLKGYGDMESQLRQLETLYNKGFSEANRVRLY